MEYKNQKISNNQNIRDKFGNKKSQLPDKQTIDL